MVCSKEGALKAGLPCFSDSCKGKASIYLEKSLRILGEGVETSKKLCSVWFSKCIDIDIEIFLVLVARVF